VTIPSRARRTARLIQAIASRKQGVTVRQLCAATGASRATLYRDFNLLKETGYTVRTETVNGEARYFIDGSELAQRALSPREHATAALAHRALASIAGTGPVQELERLLLRARGEPMERLNVDIPGPASRAHPDILRSLQAAAAEQRVLSIRYRGTRDEHPKARRVHPIALQVVDGAPYLIAWDEGAKGVRTFKALRVSVAKKLRDKCRVPAHATVPIDARARSVKVWSSAPVDVRIRIAKGAARYASEWPLTPEQAIEPAANGAVDVCARVYGLEETLRWTLRWGQNAEALEPGELRARVAEELGGALARYEVEGVRGRERRAARRQG
jgi:predicted DNA-binding transcriptional regulator YafY